MVEISVRIDEVFDEEGFEHDAEYDTVDSITLRFSNLFGRAQYLRESGLRSLIVIAGGLLLWLIFVWVTAAAQLGQNDSSTFDHDLRKSLAHFTVPVSAVDSLISEINSEIDFVAKEIAKIVGDDLALGVRDVLERQITENLVTSQ